MNRVWKHFIVGPGGFMLYVAVVTALSLAFPAGEIVIPVVFILLPFLAFILGWFWQEAKRKVEWENREMMHSLKGDDRSDLYEN